MTPVAQTNPVSRRAMVGGLSAMLSACASGAGQRHDIIIEGADLIDGAGAPRKRADIAVLRGRISAIGDLSHHSASRRVDASGKVVTPGFIDLLGQDCLRYITSPRTIECRLRQGITTHFAGEGWSHAPEVEASPQDEEIRNGPPHGWATFADLNAFMQREGLPINIMHNVGAGQVRMVAIGRAARPVQPAELARMEALVDRAMRDGAAGVSSALIYPPHSYASTGELISLAKVAGRYGGGYYTHIRNESARLLEGIDEAIEIGRAASVPVHIFHLKAAGQENWSLIDPAIDRINAARARGLNVTADIYPYINNGVILRAFVDPDSQRDPDLFSKLGDPNVRARVRHAMESDGDWENWYRHTGRDWTKVLITSAGSYITTPVAGISLAEASAREGRSPWDLYFDLLAAEQVWVAPETMNEGQKRRILREPWVSFCSDSLAVDPQETHTTHPRTFGTFPRVFAQYVREERVLTIEDAVRRMTSLAASTIGARDRGVVAVGMRADLAVFDPQRIRDRATLAQPTLFSEGIEHLLVNGVFVIDNQQLTGARAGQILRRNLI